MPQGKVFALCAKIQFYDWVTIGMNILQENLENLTFRGHNDGKRNRGKQRITYLTSMCKSLLEKGFRVAGKGQNLLRTTKERKLS